MLTLRGVWPGAARQVLHVVVLMVVVIANTRPVAADVDLTGRWELVTTFPASSVEVDVHQFGSNLVILFVVAGTPNYSGTIDPVTGAFSMSANGICGGSDTLIGTATSSTLTGTLAVQTRREPLFDWRSAA